MIETLIPGKDTDYYDDLEGPETIRFFSTKSGYAIDKTTLFGRVIVPTIDNPFLPKLPFGGRFYSDIKPLPIEVIGKAWSFFRTIYEKHHSESMVLLTWNGENYGLLVPTQIASYAKVKATIDNIPAGVSIVGSIHSHCNFGAFHSGTDTHDADSNDGLHLTLGHVDRDVPEIAAMVSFAKVHFTVEPEDAVEGIELIPHPPEWDDKVSKPVIPAWQPKPYSPQNGFSPGWKPTHGSWLPQSAYQSKWLDDPDRRDWISPESIRTTDPLDEDENSTSDPWVFAALLSDNTNDKEQNEIHFALATDIDAIIEEAESYGWEMNVRFTRIDEITIKEQDTNA